MILKTANGAEFLIDSEDFEKVQGYGWYAVKGRNTSYIRAQIPGSGERGKKIYLHHLIVGQPSKGHEVDHKNQNGLDNRRENLRIVPRSVNRANSKQYANNKTGYRGVSKNLQGKFVAFRTINGVTNYLGSFDTPEEAAKAYQKTKNRR